MIIHSLILFLLFVVVTATLPSSLVVQVDSVNEASAGILRDAINDLSTYLAQAARMDVPLNLSLTEEVAAVGAAFHLLKLAGAAAANLPMPLRDFVTQRSAFDNEIEEVGRHFVYADVEGGSGVWLVGARAKNIEAAVYVYLAACGVRFTLPGDHWATIPSQALQSIYPPYTATQPLKVVSNAPKATSWSWFGTGGCCRIAVRQQQMSDGALRASEFSAKWNRWYRRTRHPNFESWSAGHSYEGFWSRNKQSILSEADGMLYFAASDWYGNQRATGGSPKFHATHHGSISCADSRATVTYDNGNGTQLCEDLDDYMTRRNDSVLERFAQYRLSEANFDDNDPTQRSVSVEPSDGGGHCRCRKCRNLLRASSLADKDATASDLTAHVTNYVARRVAERHPGRYVSLYAYNEHGAPPTVPLEENVFVMVAPGGWVQGIAPGDVLPAWRALLGEGKLGVREYVQWFSSVENVMPYNAAYHYWNTWRSYVRQYGARAVLLESSYTGTMMPFMSQAFIDYDLYACGDDNLPSASVMFERQRALFSRLFPHPSVFQPVWRLIRFWHWNPPFFQTHRGDVGRALDLVKEASDAVAATAATRTAVEQERLLLRMRDLKIYALQCAMILRQQDQFMEGNYWFGRYDLAKFAARAIDSPMISGYYLLRKVIQGWAASGSNHWTPTSGAPKGDGYLEAEEEGRFAKGNEYNSTAAQLLDAFMNETQSLLQPVPNVPHRAFSTRLRPITYKNMTMPLTHTWPNWRGWQFAARQVNVHYSFYSYGTFNISLMASVRSNGNPKGPHYWRVFRMLDGSRKQFIEYREFNVSSSWVDYVVHFGYLERGVYKIETGVTDRYEAYFQIWVPQREDYESARKVPIVMHGIHWPQFNRIGYAAVGFLYLPQNNSWITGSFGSAQMGAWIRRTSPLSYVWLPTNWGYGLKKAQSVNGGKIHSCFSLRWSHTARNHAFTNAPNYISVTPEHMMLPVDAEYAEWRDEDANIVALRCLLPTSVDSTMFDVKPAIAAIKQALSLPTAVLDGIEYVEVSTGYAQEADGSEDGFSLVIDYSLDASTAISDDERYEAAAFDARMSSVRALLEAASGAISATGIVAIRLPSFHRIEFSPPPGAGVVGSTPVASEEEELASLLCLDYVPPTTTTTKRTTTTVNNDGWTTTTLPLTTSSAASSTSTSSSLSSTSGAVNSENIETSSSSTDGGTKSAIVAVVVCVLLVCMCASVAVAGVCFYSRRRRQLHHHPNESWGPGYSSHMTTFRQRTESSRAGSVRPSGRTQASLRLFAQPTPRVSYAASRASSASGGGIGASKRSQHSHGPSPRISSYRTSSGGGATSTAGGLASKRSRTNSAARSRSGTSGREFLNVVQPQQLQQQW